MSVLGWISLIPLSDQSSAHTILNQKLNMLESQPQWETISQAISLKSRTFALTAIDAFRLVSILKVLVAMDGSMIKSVDIQSGHLDLLLIMSVLNVGSALIDVQLEHLLRNQKLSKS